MANKAALAWSARSNAPAAGTDSSDELVASERALGDAALLAYGN
jgi:hypothetical protein